MKLEELTLAMVARAVNAYLEIAYGSVPSLGTAAGGGPSRPEMELLRRAAAQNGDAEGNPGGTIGDVLDLFQEQSVREGGRTLRRYSLRLGNRNYPFMKLQVLEHIVPGEFYFSVDTHDAHELDPSFPDYEAWTRLQGFNRELKGDIERRFRELQLPTAATIRDLCRQREDEQSSQNGRTPPVTRGRILVVDDEDDLAAAVRSVLHTWAFETTRAADGAAGVEMAQRTLPDLVLLDFELPEMDGIQVIEALRADERTRAIPILLCTAGKIALSDIRKADGFLAKPFADDLLRGMIDRLLGPADGTSGDGFLAPGGGEGPR
ncbi:MAG: response regulator [Planctomycetes bacterium]|nr:response regulator [Planctomycetota bacterium]